jgi:hypothetical protein
MEGLTIMSVNCPSRLAKRRRRLQLRLKDLAVSWRMEWNGEVLVFIRIFFVKEVSAITG